MTRSVRFRITALATLIVVFVLAVTGFALVVLQRRALTSAVDDALRQRADDLETVYASGALPQVLGVGADETFAQLALDDGTVLAASENVAAAALDVPQASQREVVATVSLPAVDDDPFRLLSRRVSGPAGEAVLHVGGSLDDARDGASALARSLMLAIPLVAAVMTALVWWLVGKALRPVESIRTEVAAISGSALHRRVPVPDTGDEIERLASTMNAMLDRVEDASRRQQRFAADASHELRSPLTRMRSEIEVDMAHPDSADLEATQRSVLEEIAGLERLIDDLLHLARSDAGTLALDHVELDILEIAERQVEHAYPGSTVALHFEGRGPAWVAGDPRALGRAVGNLLDNAIRHAVARVDVAVLADEGVVVIAVADDGPGIPAASRELVFERFTRLDEARTAESGGTGLGLAIVRDIVERHGGSVRVHSDNGGARFVVELPALRTT
jgi:heavy metal sensor kinase